MNDKNKLNNKNNTNQKKIPLKLDKHKTWLILGITIAVVAVLFLVLYSPVREALFGKALSAGELCVSSNECASGFCDGGVCAPLCTADADCPPDRICNILSGECLLRTEEGFCDDSVDNDKDGLIDCADSDCAGQPVGPTSCCNLDGSCPSRKECISNVCQWIYQNCLQGTCPADYFCDSPSDKCVPSEPSESICNDGYDNDGDTFIDCTDPDCEGDPACVTILPVVEPTIEPSPLPTIEPTTDLCAGVTCTPIETTCPDTFIARCTPACDSTTGQCGTCTPDCTGHEVPIGSIEICDDTIDNDGDDLIDCLDPDCYADPADPVCVECTDSDGGKDYFVKGTVAKEGWATTPDRCENEQLVEGYCHDTTGNPTVEYVDCPVDTTCQDGACVAECTPETEICDDNIDNDCDGLVDCADPDCDGQIGGTVKLIDVYCQAAETTCDDVFDNDADGLIDCKDSDCASQADSEGQLCCQNDADCVAAGLDYICQNNICAVEAAPEIPVVEEPEVETPVELPSVECIKVDLEELSTTKTDNIITFNTKLTAKESLASFKVITQLEDAATPGVVLLYKTETISKLAADETRTIQTVYQPLEDITQIKKKVIVYDQLPEDTIGCGKLEHTHATS